MIKRLICTECPKGCALSVEIENRRVIKVSGEECPKGEKYAASEAENPVRILTATVLTRGLSLKAVPARTDKPIPKARILEAMDKIKKIRIDKPIRIGDVIAKNFLGLEVNLVAARDCY